MAKQPGLDFQSAKGGLGELKRRLLFVIGALIVFRIGSFIPIPGIDAAVLAKLLEQQRGTIIEMFNMFSGGALSRASIFALGIMPYISASIIIQLLTVVHPTLAEIKKEGESGRRKISQYTRYGTLVLAIFQSIGIATGLPNMPGMQGLVMNPGFAFYFTAVVSLVTGTMFLMWLGEQITERGIGNGISIIIFAGIVAGLPPAIAHTIEQARQGDLHFLVLLLVAVLVFAVTFFVVFVERGQVLAKPGTIKPHTKFESEVYILSKDEGGRHTPFFKGYRPQFYFRTTDVTGTIELPEGVEMVMPGDNIKMVVTLIHPIAMDDGLRFAIREGGRTVGAGVVAKVLG
ncbi:hypothetical protein [Salmonella enterica]|uniref:EF-Tu C-terminal domain-related protein n=1 Tax=Salmonella enterica TaxID=28901 RepID=UPI0005E389B5|nr:hypothetical protein [Salmonella enterica]CHR44668.1 preprotein translocase subunit [Salmonella enterica subsp. enterica serovar Typhi]